MAPVVRYMLLCDDVRIDPETPSCTHIDCLMSSIISQEEPPFPLVREMMCIYLVLTECYGHGTAQIRVAYLDGEQERPLFGSSPHQLDFTAHSPLEVLGVIFRIEGCRFPQPGQYAVQFWYNDQKLEERPLRLKARDSE